MTTSTYVDNRDHAEMDKTDSATIEVLRRVIREYERDLRQLRHDCAILVRENLELQNLVHKK